MSQEKNEIIEYTADYRSAPKSTRKTALISKNIQQNSKPSTTSTAVKPKSTTKNGEKSHQTIDSGPIKISNSNKKQLGIYRFFFAGVTMILAVVGVSILFSAMSRTTSVINNSPTYAKYNNYIAPVVMHDPSPFSELSTANSEMIISSSIWRNILQNGCEHYKEFDEQGLTLIPTSDIQKAATELFGPETTINLAENIFGPFYSYTAGEENFHISAISNLGTFVPYIEEMTEKNNELILTVSYLSRDDKFLSADDNKVDSPTPVKQMIYKLKLNSALDKYYISAVENK